MKYSLLVLLSLSSSPSPQAFQPLQQPRRCLPTRPPLVLRSTAGGGGDWSRLAQEWASMNRDHDGERNASNPPAKTAAAAPPVLSQRPLQPQSNGAQEQSPSFPATSDLNRSSREWATLNKETTATSNRIGSSAPMPFASVPPQAQVPLPADPKNESPQAKVSAFAPAVMADLAREWTASNNEKSSNSSSNSAAFSVPPKAPAPLPVQAAKSSLIVEETKTEKAASLLPPPVAPAKSGPSIADLAREWAITNNPEKVTAIRSIMSTPAKSSVQLATQASSGKSMSTDEQLGAPNHKKSDVASSKTYPAAAIVPGSKPSPPADFSVAPVVPASARAKPDISIEDLARQWTARNYEASSSCSDNKDMSKNSVPVSVSPAKIEQGISTPAKSSPSYDDLAKAWGAMNRPKDDVVISAPTMAVPAPVPAPLPKAAPVPTRSPPVAPGPSYEDLAKAWGAMNKPKDEVVSAPAIKAASVPLPAPKETSVSAPAPRGASGPSYEDLAKAWTAMNQPKDEIVSAPVMKATPLPLPAPKETPASTPASRGASGSSYEDLAKAWAAMNQAKDEIVSRPVIKAPALPLPALKETPASAPAPRVASGSSYEDLAKVWAAMNRPKDEIVSAPVMKTAPVPAPAPKEKPVTSAPAVAMGSSFDDLAKQWSTMNKAKDSDPSAPSVLSATTFTAQKQQAQPQSVQAAPKSSAPAITIDDLAKQWSAMNPAKEPETFPTTSVTETTSIFIPFTETDATNNLVPIDSDSSLEDVSAPEQDNLYLRRTKNVARQAESGRSRWGPSENDKAMLLTGRPKQGSLSLTKDWATAFDPPRWVSMKERMMKSDSGSDGTLRGGRRKNLVPAAKYPDREGPRVRLVDTNDGADVCGKPRWKSMDIIMKESDSGFAGRVDCDWLPEDTPTGPKGTTIVVIQNKPHLLMIPDPIDTREGIFREVSKMSGSGAAKPAKKQKY